MYYEQGGASSQIVFNLPNNSDLSKCKKPVKNNRLSKLMKTNKIGLIDF